MAREDSRMRANVLDGDEVQGVLSGAFYAAADAPSLPREEPSPSPSQPPSPSPQEKPTHYKVICISMYTKDLARLDSLVEELKSRGVTKANRSALIRAALDQIDLDRVPRGM